MNAPDMMRAMEIAMWELAEAGQKEKQAASLRISAAKRISQAHAILDESLKAFQSKKTTPHKPE